MVGRFLAVLICLLAFGLAVYDLEFRSMWYDEWLSWQWSQMNPVTMTTDTANHGGHPPTYYAVLWLWTRLTMTEQLSAMRLSSVLFGVMTVALTYRLTLEWFRSQPVALVAATVTTTSSLFVYFMRELRMYTLMVLLVTLSWWAFERFVHGKKHGALLYTLTLATMAYTYYFTGFIALLQFGLILLFYRGRLPRLLVSYAVVLLVLLPWLPSFIGQVQNDAQYAEYGLELPGIGVVAKGAATQGTNMDSVRSFIRRYTNDQPYLVIGMLAVGAVIGGAHTWHAPRTRKLYVAAVLWFAGTIAIFFGGNLITPLYNPRYLIMMIPALGILIGLGFVGLPRRYQWLFGVWLVIFGVFTHTQGFFGLRTPHNELLGTVAADFQPGDRIWYNLEAGAMGSSLYDAPEYYLSVKYTGLQEEDFVWNARAELENPAEVPRIWDVRDIYTPLPDEVHADMLNERRVTERHVIGEYRVTLYETPPETEPARFGDVFAVQAAPPPPTAFEPGDTLHTTLWVDLIQPPVLDYSMGLHLRTPGGELVAQQDMPLVYTDPFDDQVQLPTSQWQPAAAPYVLHPEFAFPADLPAGRYALWLTLYHWQESPDGLPLQAPEHVTSDGNFIRLAQVTVQ